MIQVVEDDLRNGKRQSVPVTGLVVAYRMGRGIALLFHNRSTRRGEWSAARPGRFTPGEDPVPIAQEAMWDPGPVRTAENLAPPGFDPRNVRPVISLYTD